MSKSLILKSPGPNDTYNALNLFSTIGWKALFTAQVINSNWIIHCYSGANS
jgi:hypothetical protein